MLACARRFRRRPETKPASRAFGASTFEEEKRRLLEAANDEQTPRSDITDVDYYPVPAGVKELVEQLRTAASDEARNDVDIALASVRLNGKYLEHFGRSVRDNVDVMVVAVRLCPASVLLASEERRAEKAFMLRVIKAKPCTLKYASEELRGDREVALASAGAYGEDVFHTLSTELRSDAEFLIPYFQEWGSCLSEASDEMRANKQVVMAAVKSSGEVLGDASEELRADREVVLEAVRHSYAFRGASRELRADKEVVLVAVGYHGDALESASPELRADKEVVLTAVAHGGSALEWASFDLQADKEVVLTAVAHAGRALEWASFDLQADKEVVLTAVASMGEALEWASPELRGDKEVVWTAVQSEPFGADALRYASSELQADKDFVLLAARLYPNNMYFWPCGCYKEAGKSLHQIISEEEFLNAASSPMAVQGETAPILAVSLCSSTISEDSGSQEKLTCDVKLLSGNSFTCDVPMGEDRLRPTVNDLAVLLLEELPRQSEIVEAKRIFITLEKGDGDFDSLSVWHRNQPLSEYL